MKTSCPILTPSLGLGPGPRKGDLKDAGKAWQRIPPGVICCLCPHAWPALRETTCSGGLSPPQEGLRAPPGPSPGAEGAQASQAGRVVRGLDTRGRLQNRNLRADCTASRAWAWQPAQRGGVQGAAPMGPSSACASWSPPHHRQPVEEGGCLRSARRLLELDLGRFPGM